MMQAMIKQNSKQKGCAFSPRVILLAVVIMTFIHVLFFAGPVHSELKAMTGDELKTTTAQAGFTNFTLNNNTARLFLDIHIETYATINSFAAGWYTKAGSAGWDQKWDTLKIGTSASDPLVIDGLVFITDFDDLSKTDPVLERVIIGSNRLQGTISGNFSSFTGIYSSSLTGSGSPDAILDRSTVLSGSPVNFVFDSNASATSDKGLFFVLNMNPGNFGIQVVAGYDEKSLPLSGSGTPWWDSP